MQAAKRHYNKAMSAVHENDWQQCEWELQAAIQIDPTMIISYLQLAAMYGSIKQDWHAAIHWLTKAALQCQKSPKECILDYRPRGLQVKLTKWVVWYALGVSLFVKGNGWMD